MMLISIGNNWNSTITWHHTQIISQNSLSVCEISRGKNREIFETWRKQRCHDRTQAWDTRKCWRMWIYWLHKNKNCSSKKAVKKWKDKLEIRWYTYLTKTFNVEQSALKLKIRTHTYTHNFKCPKGLNRHLKINKWPIAHEKMFNVKSGYTGKLE